MNTSRASARTPLRQRRLNINRICVDSRSLIGEGTGIATYTRGLMAALRQDGRDPGSLNAAGNSQAWIRATRAILPMRRQLSACGGDLVGWDIFRLAQVKFSLTGRMLRLTAPGPAGVMHWTYPMPIMIEGWANLYTVHDTIPFRSPHLTPVDRDRHLAILRAITAVASRIVTVSDVMRQDIIDALGCAPDQVVNCSQAILVEETPPIPTGYSARGYFLFCGRIERRKNLERLIVAYRASGTAMPLLLVGPIVEESAEILAAIEGDPAIRYLDYVGRSELIALVARARALLSPSLAEGFGLPVAEAMAVGTPTLISRDRALIETAGGAALVVDEEDEWAIADAITRLAADNDLCEELSSAGRIRAGAFTPQVFAEKLDRLYKSL